MAASERLQSGPSEALRSLPSLVAFPRQLCVHATQGARTAVACTSWVAGERVWGLLLTDAQRADAFDVSSGDRLDMTRGEWRFVELAPDWYPPAALQWLAIEGWAASPVRAPWERLP